MLVRSQPDVYVRAGSVFSKRVADLNGAELVPVPAGVVTLMGPAVAFSGNNPRAAALRAADGAAPEMIACTTGLVEGTLALVKGRCFSTS